MALKIIRNDITRMEVDAIVNPTNSHLLPSGGADAAIHAAAGKQLRQACRKIGTLKPGQAAATEGFSLPCRYVIHTAGPRWYDGKRQERRILSECYRSSLSLAVKLNCRSIALPLIASGTLGFPKDQALYIAVEEIRSFLENADLDVTLVVYDQKAFRLSQELYHDIQSFLSEHEIHERPREVFPCAIFPDRTFDEASPAPEMSAPCAPMPCEACYAPKEAAPKKKARIAKKAKKAEQSELDHWMEQLDESFSQMLLRKIDESDMTDSQCYKAAHIDRKLFSKIRSDVHYKPSKATVLAFAIALELPLPEAEDMLQKAGFALSPSNKGDMIVKFFLMKGIYDLFQINEALFAFDQSLIGV